MRVGVYQDTTPSGNMGTVLDAVRNALTEARNEGIDLMVFPECYLTGYYHPADEVAAVAQSVTPDVIAQLQMMADTFGIAYIMGSYLPNGSGVDNVAFVMRPGISAPLIYTKRALFGEWENVVFQRGDAPLFFDYLGVRCAVLICFDVVVLESKSSQIMLVVVIFLNKAWKLFSFKIKAAF